MKEHRPGSLESFRNWLSQPVDGASVGVFRLAFGGLLSWHIADTFLDGAIARHWIEPGFHFTYPGFGWVRPWPGWGMYVHQGALLVLAVLVAFGVRYRLAMGMFTLGFTYTFLLEHALYLNHLYLVCLLSALMTLVPADRCFALGPKVTSFIPRWSVLILRLQLGIVYLYAGLAKLNSDWFAGEPLNNWLAEKRSTPVLGHLFASPEAFRAVSLLGLIFDLSIVPLLLYRRTRPFAYVGAVGFHLLNAWFFNIGIFPWLGIAMTTLFFQPSWPRRVFRSPRPHPDSDPQLEPMPRVLYAGLAAYFALQLLLPFRHWLYPGDVAWTEEGHEFSWRMRLREKVGAVVFDVFDPVANAVQVVEPEEELTSWQASAMVKRPELIRQFAHHLASRAGRPVEVHVRSMVKLNEREPRAIVDPAVDLGHVPFSLGRADWITEAPPAP